MAFNIEREIRIIKKQLALLLEREERNKSKETWVTAGVIKDLTGWNDTYLKKVRKYNMVKSRNTGKFFEYCLESLNPMFLKSNNGNIFSNVLVDHKI